MPEKVSILQKEIDNLKEIQEQLLSIASHDLKTPLTSIIGFARIIRDKPDIDDIIRVKCLDAIIQESERMVRLLRNMIIWQHIKEKKIILSMNNFNFSLFLKEALKDFSDRIDKNNINLIVTIEDNLLLTGDNEILKDILENLLGNIFTCKEEAGQIELKAWKNQESKINLLLSNTAYSLNETIREAIFTNKESDLTHVKIDKSIALGLIVARSLIELHGGKINFELNTSGGSKFIIEFDNP